jgi:hypothetical protein
VGHGMMLPFLNRFALVQRMVHAGFLSAFFGHILFP